MRSSSQYIDWSAVLWFGDVGGGIDRKMSGDSQRRLLLEKGKLIMGKSHVPGGMDPEQEAYFFKAAK